MGEDSDALLYTPRVPQLANAKPMLDFVGINIYRPIAYELASDEFPGWREIPCQWDTRRCPRPGGWAPKFAQSLWKSKEIFITGNGCASANVDVLAEDGDIYDADRIMFLRSYCPELSKR